MTIWQIPYFATSYSYAPDHVGRAAIRLDGVEIVKSDYYRAQQLQWESYRDIKNNANELCISDAWREAWVEAVNKGGFDNKLFYAAFEEYDNQSIELSLKSNNALVRIFAVMDRRVGKRRLKGLSEAWKNEAAWVMLFLNLRLEAEGISL